ncbi:hypothetical protein AB0L66_10290 [Streptomyces sp. NPDC052207]|uniref:hypothetical protein n=1 Tax=Streptomyces sp. NPDC052207 TaxID=3155418 RepID=UPI0034390B63
MKIVVGVNSLRQFDGAVEEGFEVLGMAEETTGSVKGAVESSDCLTFSVRALAEVHRDGSHVTSEFP